jgi:hypothetical protein
MEKKPRLTPTDESIELPSGTAAGRLNDRQLAQTSDPSAGPVADQGYSTNTALGVKQVKAVAEKPLKEQLYEALRLSEEDFGSEFVIGSQDSAIVTATSASRRVRGGGIGATAWLAKITGADAEYGVNREFSRAGRSLSGSGRSGTIQWVLDGDGIYEYRGWAESSQRSARGFCAVLDGRIASLGNRKAAVTKAAAILDKGGRL